MSKYKIVMIDYSKLSYTYKDITSRHTKMARTTFKHASKISDALKLATTEKVSYHVVPEDVYLEADGQQCPKGYHWIVETLYNYDVSKTRPSVDIEEFREMLEKHQSCKSGAKLAFLLYGMQ